MWHKIDLVRVRDRRTPGGWRFYAHLLVHQAGYEAPSTQARRTQIPTDRRAGVDANVSNLALASFPADRPEQLLIDQITCTAEQQLTAHKAARKARARQRALDRSRRNTNSDQYGPSPRQQARAARRAAAGLSPNGCSIRVGRGMPVLMGSRCAATATTAYPADTTACVPIMPPNPAARARPNRPAPSRWRRGSWPPTAT